jgi:hypothetical protein
MMRNSEIQNDYVIECEMRQMYHEKHEKQFEPAAMTQWKMDMGRE